jgi:hypothetical protein
MQRKQSGRNRLWSLHYGLQLRKRRRVCYDIIGCAAAEILHNTQATFLFPVAAAGTRFAALDTLLRVPAVCPSIVLGVCNRLS